MIPDQAKDRSVAHGTALVIEQRACSADRQVRFYIGQLVANFSEYAFIIVHAVLQLEGNDRHAGAGGRLDSLDL